MALGRTKKKSNGRGVEAARKEAEKLREARRNRFRILACVDGSDASYEAVRMAARLGARQEVDIIILYVRAIDQGLRSGGLQVRVARENMLEWGLDLPGIKYLDHAIKILNDIGFSPDGWEAEASHTDTWNDPVGDNKVEYRHADGRSVVLKLKTEAARAGP